MAKNAQFLDDIQIFCVDLDTIQYYPNTNQDYLHSFSLKIHFFLFLKGFFLFLPFSRDFLFGKIGLPHSICHFFVVFWTFPLKITDSPTFSHSLQGFFSWFCKYWTFFVMKTIKTRLIYDILILQ